MPSFLTKVFGRKKDEKEHASSKRHSASGTSLLEGKFEAVSPNVSPSATHFTDSIPHVKEKEKDKETPFSLFRPKSRQPSSSSPDTTRSSSPKPLLTLSLAEAKEERNRTLGVVFEADPDDRRVLSEAVVGERRLNSSETLSLVKACSAAIVDRGGLETLGVMHPHWYSASPDIQRKLISLFILSLTSQGQALTLPPSSSPSHLFDSELSYTRSPHDIAAVLRWALRHLQLDGNSFGANTDGPSKNEEAWQWYPAYAEAERSSGYPSDAFTKSLVPQLPQAHHELLKATLDIISSLAAHAETNGSSGSKLSKFLGLWLLTAQRSQASDDWSSFYARWERAGRILEHLYLSYIRDEASHEKMPIRLVGLVKQYPYGKSAAEDGLLPRPRFSTRRFDALFVRAETQLTNTRTSKPRLHPVKLVREALNAEVTTNLGEHAELWEKIKKAAIEGDKTDAFSVSRIFDEDTLNLFALIPLEETTPIISISIPSPPPVTKTNRRRSTSLSGAANGNGKATNGSTTASPAASPTSPTSPANWIDFSSAGFGESTIGQDFAATLMDKDVEKTSPPDLSRQPSKKRRATSPTIPFPPNRRSMDNPVSPSKSIATEPKSPKEVENKPKAAQVKLTQIDEAFIDFWGDALTDPIAASWPSFVVCKLKSNVGLTFNEKPINWVVIEHAYTTPPPPPTAEPSSPTAPRRASSPKPSLRSNMSARKSSTFTAARKQFNFFGSKSSKNAGTTKTSGPASPTLGGRKKGTMSPRIGEMGEILPEVEEGSAEPAESSKPAPSTSATGLGIITEAEAPAVPPKIEETTTMELAPVPLVDAPPPVEATPVSTEAVHTDEDKEKLTVALAAEPTPTDEAPDVQAEASESEEKSLPPAPEPVVLAGSTPGPQVALDSSEPVALAEAASPEVPPKEKEESQPAAPVEEIIPEAPAQIEPVESQEDILPEDPVVPETVEPVAEPVKEELQVPVETTAVSVPDDEAQAPVEPTEAVTQTPSPETPAAEPEVLPTEPVTEEAAASVEESVPFPVAQTPVEDIADPIQEVETELPVEETKVVEEEEEKTAETEPLADIAESSSEPDNAAQEPVLVEQVASVEKTEPVVEPVESAEPVVEATTEVPEPIIPEPPAPVKEDIPAAVEAESTEASTVPPAVIEELVDPAAEPTEQIATSPLESKTDDGGDHLDPVQENGSRPKTTDDVVDKPLEGDITTDVHKTSTEAEETIPLHSEEKPSPTDP